MRIVGIDPSSSVCGLALVEAGELVLTDAWFRPKHGSAAERLVDCFLWLNAWLLIHRPDTAVIEFLSVERNAATTRVISHFQAVCALACKIQGLVIIEARVSSARKEALGNGGLSKDKAFAIIKQRFPDHDFGRADKGGYDKSDALVLALAGPRLMERS